MVVADTYSLGNGYRYYNSYLRRFIQPDKLSQFDSNEINSYVYCNNDPVNKYDPTGAYGQILTIAYGLMTIHSALSIQRNIYRDPNRDLTLDYSLLGLEIAAPGIGHAISKGARGISNISKVVSKGSKILSRNNNAVMLSGTMTKLEVFGTKGYFVYDDLGKQGKRFNIAGHGGLDNGASYLVVNPGNVKSGNQVFNELVQSGYNISAANGYVAVRTIVCHSAEGGARAFGAQIKANTQLPVISYKGVVSANFNIDDMIKLKNDYIAIYGPRATMMMAHQFAQRGRTQVVYKTNPYSPVRQPQNWLKFSYQPIVF